MPGFLISNFARQGELVNYDNTRCIQDQKQYRMWTIKRNTLNKFTEDKLLSECDKYIIVIEGVIYNKLEIIERYEKENWENTLRAMIERNPYSFFEIFDGPFSGAVYFKMDHKWMLFTGPLGEKAVFYYCDRKHFLAGSQLNYISDTLRINDITRKPDVDGINTFLGYGYYLDDTTCLKEVKRLYPGNFIFYDENTGLVECKSYYKADYAEIKGYHEDYWIDRMHDSFNKAVEKILKKNKEYGYKTLLDISSGGDSRMICYTAKECNAEDVMLDCYAQSGSGDAVTSQHIANKIGYSYIYLSIDNADSLMHVDENVLMTNGCTIYYGITGGKVMLEALDRELFGLEITGLLGDVHDGSMVTSYPGAPIDLTMKKYRVSNTLVPYKEFPVKSNACQYFENNINEHFWFYQRGMLFGMTSYFIRQNFLEVGTPFGDLEFLKAYHSAPWQDRVHGHLLRKWMIKYFPNAADINYGETGTSIKNSILPGMETYITWKRRCKKALRSILNIDRPVGMNDFEYWYRHNPHFHQYIDTYIEENRTYADIDKTIRNNVEKLLGSNIITDKLLAVTALSVIKNFIN